MKVPSETIQIILNWTVERCVDIKGDVGINEPVHVWINKNNKLKALT